MTKGIHHHPAGTKAARQIMASTGVRGITFGSHSPPNDPAERERYLWNARIEAEKLKKKAKK